MTTVTRLYHFAASHRLHSQQLSEDENTRLYGKCNHPFGHGHDYVLEVTIAGPVSPVTGLVLPLAKLDRLVAEHVLALFASRNINLDVPQFETLVATTENIAAVIVQLLQENWSGYVDDAAVRLRRVHIQETGRNGFEILLGTATSDLPSPETQKEFVHA